MKFDSPITAAAKNMIRIIDTGYLPDKFRRDIETLLQGALAYEVVTGKAVATSTVPDDRTAVDEQSEVR